MWRREEAAHREKKGEVTAQGKLEVENLTYSTTEIKLLIRDSSDV
jgi:hypothetical protein